MIWVFNVRINNKGLLGQSLSRSRKECVPFSTEYVSRKKKLENNLKRNPNMNGCCGAPSHPLHDHTTSSMVCEVKDDEKNSICNYTSNLGNVIELLPYQAWDCICMCIPAFQQCPKGRCWLGQSVSGRYKQEMEISEEVPSHKSSVSCLRTSNEDILNWEWALLNMAVDSFHYQ